MKTLYAGLHEQVYFCCWSRFAYSEMKVGLITDRCKHYLHMTTADERCGEFIREAI